MKTEITDTMNADTNVEESSNTDTALSAGKTDEINTDSTDNETERTDTATADTVSTHGQLSVSGSQLVDESGDVYQLRGMSTHGIAWFPEFINADAFAAVQSAGGNAIRIAMYTDTDNGYLSDEKGNMELVSSAIEIAKSLDMYIIIDWHILSDGDPNTNIDKAIQFFDQISSQYADNPAIIYEICNEPNGVEWPAIKSYAKQVIPVIRNNAENALIIVGTPLWSNRVDEALADPIDDDNTMYAFHFYAGEHVNYEVLKDAVENNLPVIVSEWGIGYDASGQPALTVGTEFAAYLNEKNVSWCGWSLCNKDEVYSVLRPTASPSDNWGESDFTEVGQILFEALRGND